MSRCNTQCDSFYKNPTESTFNSEGPSGDNMSCAYCLSNDLEVNTGNPDNLLCDCAKQLSSMEIDKNISFDQYNQIKNCLQKQGCSTDCKTLYNEFLGSGCSYGNTKLSSPTTGSSNTGNIIIWSVLGLVAVIGIFMLVRKIRSRPTRFPSSVRY